jgi:hypothetical protein
MERGACGKPRGALYIESGRHRAVDKDFLAAFITGPRPNIKLIE